ncbi:MAG TPA: site-2 protease family protein [Gemmataceae bacterium]|jgi:tetratricopeptide (TPR) repeat protein|nr:site-2 protease family protein [Gemmataceae bacterium]
MPFHFVLLLAGTLLVVYVSHFFHELGHVVVCRWNGYLVTSFGLGFGKPLLALTVCGTRLYFCRSRLLFGLTVWFPESIYPTRTQKVCGLAGGIVFQGVLALACFTLYKLLAWGAFLWLLAGIVNAFEAAINLVPIEAKVGHVKLRSDGALILDVLLNKHEDAYSAKVLQRLQGMLGHFEAIGDHTGRYLYLLAAAAIWSELGDAEYAESLCVQAEAVPIKHRPFTRAYGALLQATVAQAAQKPDVCLARLAEADTAFQEMRHEVGLWLVQYARTGLTPEGDCKVLGEIARLSSHAFVAREPAMRSAVLILRAAAAASLPPEGPVHELAEEYRAARRSYPSLIYDLQFYKNMGRCFLRRQEWSQAEDCYRQALEAARELAAGFASESDRERFLTRQTALFTEIPIAFPEDRRARIMECLEALRHEPARTDPAS